MDCRVPRVFVDPRNLFHFFSARKLSPSESVPRTMEDNGGRRNLPLLSPPLLPAVPLSLWKEAAEQANLKVGLQTADPPPQCDCPDKRACQGCGWCVSVQFQVGLAKFLEVVFPAVALWDVCCTVLNRVGMYSCLT